MKRKLSIVGICVAIIAGLYVGSFFLVLIGQRARQWDWVDKAGVGYEISSFTDERGFYFDKDPWMQIYRPLYCPAAIFKSSGDPHEEVRLNAFGTLMFAAYYWGMWTHEDWAKASSTAKKWAGYTFSEWYPERFEWKDAGESRYPLPN